MRIAQVAPLFESVPPRLYGGTERVVHHLTEALVQRGHDVTLFASGDSSTSARLVACAPRALRLGNCTDMIAPQMIELERVAKRAHEFDVIHFHIDALHYPLSRRLATPSLTTLHGRLDIPELGPLYDEFCDARVVSISNAQREPLPQASWIGTVHHGLPPDLYPFVPTPDDYVVFVGRISREKRVDRAIAIAQQVGIPLRIAAKIDPVDRVYFEREIRELFELPGVEYIGEIGEDEKADLLGRARALLFPIDWPEPFGLVMIEAMACGTPVIAFRGGSVLEVVDPGVTGFIVDSVDGAAKALRHIAAIDRAGVRATFERRFSADRMAADYVALYAALAQRSTTSDATPQAVA